MPEDLQGFEKYTPSRLEWLVVMLNSMVHYLNVDLVEEGAVYAYTLGRDKNTITMHIKYFADMPSEFVKKFEDNGKDLAFTIAKAYNWNTWINIQTELNPIDRPSKKQGALS